MSLSKNINPSLVLVQPRKTRPFITERLLMGRKESNQTNKNQAKDVQRVGLYIDHDKEIVMRLFPVLYDGVGKLDRLQNRKFSIRCLYGACDVKKKKKK